VIKKILSDRQNIYISYPVSAISLQLVLTLASILVVSGNETP